MVRSRYFYIRNKSRGGLVAASIPKSVNAGLPWVYNLHTLPLDVQVHLFKLIIQHNHWDDHDVLEALCSDFENRLTYKNGRVSQSKVVVLHLDSSKCLNYLLSSFTILFLRTLLV